MFPLIYDYLELQYYHEALFSILRFTQKLEGSFFFALSCDVLFFAYNFSSGFVHFVKITITIHRKQKNTHKKIRISRRYIGYHKVVLQLAFATNTPLDWIHIINKIGSLTGVYRLQALVVRA